MSLDESELWCLIRTSSFLIYPSFPPPELVVLFGGFQHTAILQHCGWNRALGKRGKMAVKKEIKKKTLPSHSSVF
jgi:hypothetical protein